MLPIAETLRCTIAIPPVFRAGATHRTTKGEEKAPACENACCRQPSAYTEREGGTDDVLLRLVDFVRHTSDCCGRSMAGSLFELET